MSSKKKDMIVLVFGLPGSGKSYFASRLATKINVDYVNSDRLRKEMFPKRTYSESEKTKIYTILLNKMEEAMIKEKDLILDATFHKKKMRELFIAKSKEKGRIFFIEVCAEEAIIKDRLKKVRPYSEAYLDVYQLIKQEYEPMERPHLTLQSTNDNIDAMLKRAVQYLNNDKGTDT